MSETAQLIRLDRARQAAPQVFESLRHQIISLSLIPGTVLSRTALMEQYGLSQTPIRDALLKLAEEKLVDIFPQHATVVSPIDLRLAHQAHFFRKSIELEVVRTLALAQDKRFLAKLRGIVAEQQADFELGDLTAFAEADQAFHRQMSEAAGVPDLWTLVRSRSGHIDRLRQLHLPVPGKIQAILRDHTRILDAIAASDPAEAQQAVRDHLSGTLMQVADIKLRFPEYVRE
ncbi:GntR family transcriptional regulator [Lacibacterium aquatile]|uniref:GntR family transcriptional regulator n=1 Tax=Lacibacterium aquatile TaxID=1168082 RepID=A0ABW5DQS3_9PROT